MNEGPSWRGIIGLMAVVCLIVGGLWYFSHVVTHVGVTPHRG